MEYEIRDGKVVYKDEGPIGVLVTERHVGATAEPTLARMAASSEGRRGSLVSQIKGAPTEADAVLCYNPSKGDWVPYERSSVGGASVLLLAIAWTTPGFARVECKGDFQVTKYGLIATPYCEEENIAVVAQSYGWQVTGSQVRKDPLKKVYICQVLGRDIRLKGSCAGYSPDAYAPGR